MFTLASECITEKYDIITALPERIRSAASKINTDKLFEIRLRRGGILSCIGASGTFFVSESGEISKDLKNAIIVTDRDIKRALELLTNYSMYAYENEIKNGYITLKGGHRVGVCGFADTDNGRISHLKTVQALNYRFAREIIGVSDSIMPKIISNGDIKNTIIVSPPMCGKTTMLRDIARNLSLMGKRVSIVDERFEIASAYGGASPFDLGAGCDILSGVSKEEGMLYMLRSMSPDVIITDEIGTKEDFEIVREIKKRGVSVITSLHGTKANPPDFESVITLARLSNA